MKVVSTSGSLPTSPRTTFTHSISYLLIIIAVYLALNIALNLLIKWSLGHYGMAFPLILTLCHLSATFIFLAPAAARTPWSDHRDMIHRHWKGLLAVGMSMALNIGLNNASLAGISLSLNQVIRSSVPVITALIAIPVEGTIPSRVEAASIITLTIGVMMAVWHGSGSSQPIALGACILSTVCAGAMVSFSGKALSEKMDVVRYATFTSPVSCAVLAPFALAMEWTEFWKFAKGKEQMVAAILGGTSIVAVGHLLMNSLLIKHAGAVASTVVGNVKVAALILLSTVLLDEGKEFTGQMACGCFLALLGFIAYSHAHLKHKRKQFMKMGSTVMLVKDVELNGEENGSGPERIGLLSGKDHNSQRHGQGALRLGAVDHKVHSKQETSV